MLRFIRAEFRRHRWMAPALAMSGSAALGARLTDIIHFVHQVLS